MASFARECEHEAVSGSSAIEQRNAHTRIEIDCVREVSGHDDPAVSVHGDRRRLIETRGAERSHPIKSPSS